MEPDPSPDPAVLTKKSEITNSDINSIIGNSKKTKNENPIYGFSKKVIIGVVTLTTFVFLLSHYFGAI